ncbi:MAG: hypothetical protein IJN91_03390 [Alphaproteobacteria bacterium]|nr:hypothetical protein [Alphaproteobacteria bacterium]
MKGFKVFLSALVMLRVISTAAVFAAPEQKRTPARRQVDTAQQSARKVSTTIRNAGTRAGNTTQTRENTKSQAVVARPQTNTSRNVGTSIRPVTGTKQSRTATTIQQRAISPRNNVRTTRAAISRNATVPSVLSRDYSKCRDVFNNCMDEFCANKDSELKRCACSVRHSEFKNSKENLNAVEDKLLDFSQRLLTVNMDKEDALSINTATEGELAYNTKDTSESKKMLNKISQKLNTTFNDNNFGLGAVSYSLNIDSAFDNIDSLSGASTTTKIGTALYAAALPVCREMAAEVCSSDELKIAENSYQLVIEQDCNTVSKTYQAKADQARAKVLESGALLDMSRLDIHQKRNSDDMLTCKNKMLNMLTDSTVCGEKLFKCLDTTGHFINPATGKAILTTDLHLLQNTIVRPTGDMTWKQVPENLKYVTFLNTKKDYLKPAMENCQNIADVVWDGFLDDALAQIKLAQNEKLEEVRQSCTTLTAECINTANKTISDFDARALSIFGITADRTANEMCRDVLESCNALMGNIDNTDWEDGTKGIMTTKTYETILQTCRTVGENCIVQTCSSASGNFALCKDSNSISRGSILSQDACWKEVQDCIASAGDDALKQIQASYPASSTPAELHDFCNKCDDAETDLNCYKCRLAEHIWGNCKADPVSLQASNEINPDADTLLSWMARNTQNYNCGAYNYNCPNFIAVTPSMTNCCHTTVVSNMNHQICCASNTTVRVQPTFGTITSNNTNINVAIGGTPLLANKKICAPSETETDKAIPVVTYTTTKVINGATGELENITNTIYCIGTTVLSGNTIECTGKLVQISATNGKNPDYSELTETAENNKFVFAGLEKTFSKDATSTCTYNNDEPKGWQPSSCPSDVTGYNMTYRDDNNGE